VESLYSSGRIDYSWSSW